MKRMSVILAVFVVLILIFAACGPIQLRYIVIDEGHTGFSITGLVSTLSGLGYQVKTENLETYQPQTLFDKAVIIPAPNTSFGTNAVSQLNAYMSSGGKLILLADSRNNSNNILNNLISSLNIKGVGISFNFGTISFSGYNDNILFYNTSLGDYFDTGNVKALYGRNIVNAPTNIKAAYATGNAPDFSESEIDEIGTYVDVLVAENATKGSVVAFSSMETFNNAYGAAQALLGKMINW
ncbi:MAG: hypothetical protein PWQ77_2228 [Kosmotogales bacterium]|nr:hypothetical protein [Kosmotogales bacterium]